MKKLSWIVFAALMLSGCALVDKNEDFLRAQSESNPAGAKGLLRGDELRGLSIANLIGSFTSNWTPGSPPKDGGDRARVEYEQRETDRAVALFYRTWEGDPAKAALYRNEIQSRIMAAANQRCHLWKNYIATASSSVGFWSGVVSAATGAASIAFSPEGTKDALTAVSTTSAAVGDQFDKEYLFSLTMPVIVQGVESRRDEISDSIKERRTTNGDPTALKGYPLSAAIADALEYHAACSISSGLQQAAEKLADSRNGGGMASDDKAKASAAADAALKAGKSTAEAAAAAVEAIKPAQAQDKKRTSSPAS